MSYHMQVQSFLCLTSLKVILLFLCHEHEDVFPTENKLRNWLKIQIYIQIEKTKENNKVMCLEIRKKKIIPAFQFPP